MAEWMIKYECGYEPITIAWEELEYAEQFGLFKIKSTYDRLFNEYHTDVKKITELTMALNWKIWQWYEKDDVVAQLYNELWEKCDNWCVDNLKGEDLAYFLSTTDQ